MNKVLKAVLWTVIFAVLAIWPSNFVKAADNEIIILHTNDVHCNVDGNLGLARVAWLKKQLLRSTPNVVMIDAGDAIQGNSLGKMSNGEAIVSIMNEVGYDFCIPGNHEFDYGMPRFYELAKLQKAGYYSCNIFDNRSNKTIENCKCKLNT